MASGIYVLKFAEEVFYIGKSNDIDRRWKEHANKFAKGTAAKVMQRAFYTYGMPKFLIICECHEDHIDLMESMYIRNNWREGILNTTQPTILSEHDEQVLRDNENLLVHSTVTHIKTILNLIDERVELEDKLRLSEQKYDYILNLDECKFIRESQKKQDKLDYNIALKAQIIEEQKQTIEKYKNMGFWERLFG